MAGYNGYSKSNNAIQAEENGRFPITKAIKVVKEATGLSSKIIRERLEASWGGEWHHSSKMYNRVKYYDASKLIAVVACERAAGLDWENQINGSSFAEWQVEYERLSAVWGVSAEMIHYAYFG
jgi:hypothetical protein